MKALELFREAVSRGASFALSGGKVTVECPQGALGTGLARALSTQKQEIQEAMEASVAEADRLASENQATLRLHLGPQGRGWCWIHSPTYHRSFAFLRPDWRPTEEEAEVLRELGYFESSGTAGT